jgi:hypothetical protein
MTGILPDARTASRHSAEIKLMPFCVIAAGFVVRGLTHSRPPSIDRQVVVRPALAAK